MDTQGKDGWDKVDVILKPVGGLLTALAIAYFGFVTSDVMDRRQEDDAKFRLYSELMSRREEAESALRKDMFKSIIDTFLTPQSASMEEKILNLELLAYNFHESLNVKPLFAHLKKQIVSVQSPTREEYVYRLDKVAREITKKQLLVLEGAGDYFDREIDLETFRKTPGGIELEPKSLTLENIAREFRIFALNVDSQRKEIRVRLEVKTPRESDKGVETNIAEFWVGFFDFPMIDNIRLSNGQRCAIVLNTFDSDKSLADVTVVYFPGTYASLKEKPYYQEVLQNLVRTTRHLKEMERK
jgi:hypothetical protein